MNATQWAVLVALVGFLTGCGTSTQPLTGGTKPGASAKATEAADEEADIQKALAKLSPEDRKLAEEQRFCVVNEENRLGSMGKPVKLTLKGKPVFLCCAGCKREAESDADKILERLEARKAKSTAPDEKKDPKEKATEPKDK